MCIIVLSCVIYGAKYTSQYNCYLLLINSHFLSLNITLINLRYIPLLKNSILNMHFLTSDLFVMQY